MLISLSGWSGYLGESFLSVAASRTSWDGLPVQIVLEIRTVAASHISVVAPVIRPVLETRIVVMAQISGAVPFLVMIMRVVVKFSFLVPQKAIFLAKEFSAAFSHVLSVHTICLIVLAEPATR